MSGENEPVAKVVLVSGGPEDRMRLRYIAFPGLDHVLLADADADDALVGAINGLAGGDYPCVAFESAYFKRLAHYRREIRGTAQRHYRNTMRARSIR
ncbi:hypothetical protein [Glycomyces sp. NPDC048151]|uniref:hypothetical protein n=1 Tax=Glycomyces sp. NPDC048151 TaxID=3364002 RepID=UPI0037217133